MKTIFKFLIWVILVVLLFSYTGFSQSSTLSNFEKLQLTFPVDFTEKEKKFINSLSQTDLEKLIRVIRLIVERNKSASLAKNINSQPTIYSNSPSTQTPHYNPSTGQYQSKPPSSQASQQPSGQPGQQSSDQGTPQSQSPLNSIMQGVTKGLANEVALPTNISPRCQANFGATGGGRCANAISGLNNRVKKALMESCEIIGGPVPVNSGYRDPTCNNAVGGAGGSMHTQGLAVDINAAALGEKAKSVWFVFRQNGAQGIGCYSPNTVHLDFGAARRWGSDFTSRTYHPQNCPHFLIEVFGN